MKRLRKTILLIILACAVCFAGQSAALTREAQNGEKMLTAYCNAYGYINWSRPNQTVIDIDLTKMTHLNFANARIDEGSGRAYLENEIQIALTKVTAMRETENPKLKILLTVAGEGFSKTCSTAGGRRTLAQSLAELAEKNGLDGIDIDWEFPTLDWQDTVCSPDDKGNFTLFLQELRNALGDDKYITVAGGAGRWYLNCVEFEKIIPLVDYWNVMTYAFHQGKYLDANLYPSKLGDPSGLCGDSAINMYLQAGVPAERLLLGIPYYASAKSGSYPSGRWAYRYDEVQTMLASGDYERVWDEEGQVPYLTKNGAFEITYDDEESVKIKGDYVKAHGLAGAVVYETLYDNKENALSSALWNALFSQPENELTAELNVSPDTAECSEKIALTCTADGGSGDYGFLFAVMKDGRMIYRRTNYSDSPLLNFAVQTSGNYFIKVYCIDKNSGKIASDEKNLSVF